MMDVLLIEDEDEVVDALETALKVSEVPVRLTRASSRDVALTALSNDSHFDLVITDLKIPSVDSALDASPAFGREVYSVVRSQRPGTPVWVFSGYADEEFLESIIDEARQGDPFGSGGASPMIRRFRKIHLSRVVDELRSLAPMVEALLDIEVSSGGVELSLGQEEIRLCQLVGRRLGGTTIRLRALSPGFTASRTLHAQVVDQHGSQVAVCVLKIGRRSDLEEEAHRYENNVPLALNATCFAPISAAFTDGVAGTVALAYTVAASDPRSLGDLLATDEDAAVTVVHRLREAEAQWLLAAHTEQLTVSDMCRLLSAPDLEAAASLGVEIDASALGARLIQVLKGPQHGDLHLGNVIVGVGGEAVLIDYGRTGHRIAAYDPVTLEMCLAFHPDGRAVAGEWPTADQAQLFDQLDTYLDGCPCPLFVRACRAWAHGVANGDREVWAAVLGYALRQLPFADTSNALAMAYAKRAGQLLS